MHISEQLVFSFVEPAGGADPLTAWRAHRSLQLGQLCARLGAPVGRRVEVRMKQGPPLIGVLRLAEEQLWNDPERENVVLQVGDVSFRLADIESVLRADL